MSEKLLVLAEKQLLLQNNHMGKKRVIKKTEAELIKETEKVEKKMKKEVSVKSQKAFLKGHVYIYSTYNNTIITLTDELGNTLHWRSAGNIGFKGTKKGTSFAGGKVAEAVAETCDKLRIKEISIYIKGVGGGRDAALKTFSNKGFDILSINDVTPIPHNGCRPKKLRRT